MDEIAYCENADCRVVLFLIDMHDKNCPQCGRFGRLKDVNPNEEKQV